ncbi:MAG: sulfotransferase [Symploca sp. SIO2B6]|nr:sulfotransferase [Symploca sp. SIO2B6]
MKQPSFFIVGAPKSGTTSLCKYLNRHPDIFVPRHKELNYFDTDLPTTSKIKDLAQYLSFFDEGQGKTCGEGSPSYLRSKIAFQAIKDFNPEAKIIIMLREPVSLLYSFHSQLLFNGDSEEIQDFKLALEAESDRRQGKRIPKKCTHPAKLFYRDVVKFAEQVENYFNSFGKEQVHIIIFNDFQRDTNKVYRDTLEFLGVDPEFQTEYNKKNVNKKVRNVALQNLVKHPPAKILEMGKFLIPLPSSQRRAILEALKNKLRSFNTKTTERTPLDPELRRSLQTEFAPEIERLSNLIGRDLTFWSRN